MGRVDRGEEDLRGQVGRALAVADSAHHETLHPLEVLAIEDLEDVGVDADPGAFARR